MIWRLLISFSLVVTILQAANIAGLVIVKDPGRSRGNTRAKTSQGGSTVVWLDSSVGSASRKLPVQHAVILQKNKTFLPHLLVVSAGSTVEFPNSDPIFHNAFSNYDGQIFDIGLYAPGSTRSVTFLREGVVRVFCNIHSTMSAVIVVLRSPYFTQAGTDGRFQLENVPEGAYRLRLYHERATEQTLKSLERDVDVSGPEVNLGIIELSENGFLAAPHLNKYGKPYGAAPDPSSYPGARQ